MSPMPDTTLTSAELDEMWSDDWSAAPRDGSNVLLRLHNGGIHIQRWSTSYSVFGLGGCWTDGFCTMGDKIDYSHWSAGSNLDAMLYRLGRLARLISLARAGLEAGKAEEWLPIETAPKDGTKLLLGRFTNGKAEIDHNGYMAVDHWRSPPQHDFTGWGKFNMQYWPATHWRPLSAPPAIRALPLTGVDKP